jgi:uncharacterized protein (TIGR03663 family)
MDDTARVVVTQPPGDWLDRPIDGLVRWTGEGLAWAALLGLAALSRFFDLGARAMSHDESLHAYFSWQLLNAGAYRHDPTYHGPLLYHLNAVVYWLVGASDTTARLVPALAGVGVVLALWLFRPAIGRAGAWLAACLAAISPTLLFYGRYLREDVYVAVLALLWIHAAFRYVEERRRRWTVVMALVMALSFLVKEVTFIFGPILGAFFAGTFLWRWRRGRERWGASSAGDLAILMLTMALPFAAPLVFLGLGWPPEDYRAAATLGREALVVALLFGLSAALAASWFGVARERPADRGPLSLGRWAALMALFWGLQGLFFTTFLSNVPGGLASGIVGSLGYWMGQHAVARGGQLWSYYPVLAALYEFLPLGLGTAAAVTVVRHLVRRTGECPAFLTFCLWWAAASWGAYTVAGEKMPWLLLHLVLPLYVLGGWWAARLMRASPWRAAGPQRAALIAGGTAIAACLAMGMLLAEPFSGRETAAQAETLRWLLGLGAVVGLVSVIVSQAGTLPTAAVGRLATVGVLALAVVLTVRVAVRLTYVNYDLAIEPLVYAHGTPDIKRAMAEIELIGERTGRGRDLEVAYDDASTWPLAWYLRDFRNTRYYGAQPTPGAMAAPVIIVGPRNDPKVRPFVDAGYLSRHYRLIWWPPHGFSRLSRDQLTQLLTEPAARRRLWQIVHYRRYPELTLAEWPSLQRFTVYIRRDLAQDVWNLGADPALAAAQPASTAAIPELELSPLAVHAGVYAGRPLRGPTAVAVAPDGALLIADAGNDRIVVLNADGGLRSVFGSRCALDQDGPPPCVDPDGAGPLDRGDGQVREPWGIAQGANGEIYIADTWNGRIQVFDRAGRYLRKWGRFGRNPLVDPAGDPALLYGPRGLAVDAAGALLVADTGNNRLLRFTAGGAPLQQAGGAGFALGRFVEPVGLALDPRDGSVYVADAWNRRIQRLDRQLHPIAAWTVPGWRGRGGLDKPYLGVDARGAIYASDPEDARILIYSPHGRLEAAIRLTGAVRPRPLGLALDTRRRALIVVDHANGAVLVFGTDPDTAPREVP